MHAVRCDRLVDLWLSRELVSKGSGHTHYCQDYCTFPFYLTDVPYSFVVFMPMDFMSPGVLSESGRVRIGQ
jgi:hypothetical protein